MYALVYWQILEMCELEKPAKTTHHCCSELVDRDLEVGQNVFLVFFILRWSAGNSHRSTVGGDAAV